MPDRMLEQLSRELETLRQQLAEMEMAKSQHQRVEQALQEAADKYHSLFESAGDSIFIVDPPTLRILDVNANAARRLGYSRDELRTMELDDVEVLSLVGTPGQLAWESTYSGMKVYECEYRRKDGSLVPVEVSSSLARYGNRQVFQNFVRDITARKQIEAEREQLIADLDAFAHTVAHDLKNPLNVLVGYAGDLAKNLDLLSPDQVTYYAGLLRNTSLKMGHIINELLLLASVRRSDTVDRAPLNTSELVTGALERLRMLIDQREAVIQTPDEWPVALGYAPWVEEVWANYISNAVKYGGDPPVVELGAFEHDTAVHFWVRDNGPGIAEADLSRLFNQFSRLDEARAEGHGLGLSIVSRIIQKLGGRVGVESSLGQGSVFYFILPGV